MADEFTPQFAASASYPEVGVVERAVQARDWPTIRAVYDQSDWVLRNLLRWTVADTAGIEELLREVLARDPDDLVAATILGNRLISIGWEIRTDKRAKDVSREQFAALHDYLRQSEQVLIDVCARDPGNAVAWTARQTTSMGLQLGQSESRRRYDHAVRAVPHYLPAQSSHLQQICPKWSGSSIEGVHAFARDCMLAAPPGSHNATLVLEAIREHEGTVWDDDAALDAYRASAEYRDSIVGAAERSVLHPDFQHTTGWVGTLSTFAESLSRIQQWKAAKHCFVAMGNLASTRGWDSWKEPEKKFREYRAKAMEQG
jgi:hypothetical protein